VAHEASAHAAVPSPGAPDEQHGNGKGLGAFLCWAVVFADIGTSVYYVPGILYGSVGQLAGLFVVLTLAVFLLLTIKYAEVSVRFPGGGGVVSVAARGLNPWVGAVGGMFILTSYFLTSAISARSGVEYLKSLLPGITPFVLVVTLALLALLGALNWWGIKESASVSAIIAVLALLSDLIILAVILFTVPPNVIGEVFARMFSGQHLGPDTLRVGFAGAFLAFSGLESISQLAPVMRAPRRKVVTTALLLVAVTVIGTSPLLTIFSTTLLTDPTLLAAAHLGGVSAPAPDQFISQLGQVSGGTFLEICTALTASTLLIFASNTAIIGAYHVFLALSRMHFFPAIIEKRNRVRDTPHIAIILATGIPMLVLLLVGGNIAVLGDMYAFGLLGAFSLTCIGLDVIRWRERRGEVQFSETGESDEPKHVVRHALDTLYKIAFVSERLDPATVEWLWNLRKELRQSRTALFRPLAAYLRRTWPDLKYVIGFPTTALVVLAWAVDLGTKPLATAFGGGFTVLGLGVSVINYRRQRARGLTPIFLTAVLRRTPDARLVVLAPHTNSSPEVARLACANAAGHPLIFLYLGDRVVRPLRALAIADPYLDDLEAQRTLAQIADICSHAQVSAQFVYRVGTVAVVQDVWRVLHSGSIIAEKSLAKQISTYVAPDYVRLQRVNGVQISNLLLPTVVRTSAGPTGAQPGATAPPTPQPVERGGDDHLTASAETHQTNGTNGHRHRPVPKTSPRRSEPPPRDEQEQSAVGVPEQAGEPGHTEPPSPPEVQIEDYVWTGTDLVRREDMPPKDDIPGAERAQSKQDVDPDEAD
jgi:amino acid transporter